MIPPKIKPKIYVLSIVFFISVLNGCKSKTHFNEDRRIENKVDSLLVLMTLDEKIGQLFMVQAYSNKDEKHAEFITEMIKEYHVGNLIFMQGTPEKQAELNNRYQDAAKVPLMIGFDGEWGLDMRLKNSYRFPWNMSLGAIQDNSLIHKFGRIFVVYKYY